MPVSYTQIEDPQEPSQTVYPALPMQSAGDGSTIPTLLEVQDNLSILHRHPNFFVLVTSDPDDQSMSPHVCNDTPQEAERNGEVKSEIQPLAVALNVPVRAEILLKTDPAGEPSSNARLWHAFSHKIAVKTGFPGGELSNAGSPVHIKQKIIKTIYAPHVAANVPIWL